MRRWLIVLIPIIIIGLLVMLFLRFRGEEAIDQIQTGGGGGTVGGTLPLGGSLPNNPGGQTRSSSTIPASGSSTSTTENPLFGKLSIVVDKPSIDYHVDPSGSITFVQADGQVMRLSGGKLFTLSSQAITALKYASFSPSGEKVLIVSGSLGTQEGRVFEIPSKTWITLPKGVTNPSWAPALDQLTFLSPGLGVGGLFTLDMTNPKASPIKIIDIAQEDVSLLWVTSTRILLTEPAAAKFPASMFSLNIKTSSLAPIRTDTNGLMSKWGNSMGLIFSTKENGGSANLSLVAEDGYTLQTFGLPTLPNKCVFQKPLEKTASSTLPKTSSSSIKTASATSTTGKSTSTLALTNKGPSVVCGVPRNWASFSRAVLPDDYLKRKIWSEDDVYNINLQSGEVGVIFSDQKESVDVDNPKIFKGGFYFINRYDQKIYSLLLED